MAQRNPYGSTHTSMHAHTCTEHCDNHVPLTVSGLDKKLSYRKNSKNWDTLNYHRDCPTNGIVGFYSAILRSKDADRITNRVDIDLGLHCLLRPICPNISNYYGSNKVRKPWWCATDMWFKLSVKE